MRRIAVTLALVVLPLVPAHAQFCPGVPPWVFIDVAASDGNCGPITFLAQKGVTVGCLEIDPNNRLYCPAAFVRRDQMAAFMFRFAGLAFQQGGNAFDAPAVLGTTDDNLLDIRVNNARVMRYMPNAISPNVIGGSTANLVTAGVRGATIGGGGAAQGSDPNVVDVLPNSVSDAYGTVAGGSGNNAGNAVGTQTDAPHATVAGGRNNIAFSSYSSVGGGIGNLALSVGTTVGGGSGNQATGAYSNVGGGINNSATDGNSVVAGGIGNEATGTSSVVAGGFSNHATGVYGSVGGGDSNVASGHASTVGGGARNEAAGDYSVAMGRRAKAQSHGTFVFADGNNFDFGAPNPNTFRVRATGGVRFVTGINAVGGITWSCSVFDGDAGWSCSSDRSLKENFEPVDAGHVLDRVAEVPLHYWNARGGNPAVRHLGPTAQDFKAAFGLGNDETMLSAMDAAGVALAAIQGLNVKLETRVAEQSREIAELRRMVERLSAQR